MFSGMWVVVCYLFKLDVTRRTKNHPRNVWEIKWCWACRSCFETLKPISQQLGQYQHYSNQRREINNIVRIWEESNQEWKDRRTFNQRFLEKFIIILLIEMKDMIVRILNILREFWDNFNKKCWCFNTVNLFM